LCFWCPNKISKNKWQWKHLLLEKFASQVDPTANIADPPQPLEFRKNERRAQFLLYIAVAGVDFLPLAGYF